MQTDSRTAGASPGSLDPVVIPPFCPHCKGALKYAGNKDEGYYYGCFNRCPKQPTSRCMKTKQAAYDDYHGLAG